MKSNTKNNVSKHMKHASNGIPSSVILQSIDKNKFVIDKQITESKIFDSNEVKNIHLFSSHNKLINYCNSIGLIKLKGSTNLSSQKLFKYSTKLLKTKKEELKEIKAILKDKSLNSKEQDSLNGEIASLKALNNFLEVITNSFPDIIYGLGSLKDYDLNPDNKKFLSLAINTYYNRVFSSSAFVQHFLHKASNEEKQEFLDFNKDFGLIPKNIDVTSIKMQESYPKEVVDQKLQELKNQFSEELKEKYIKDELLLDDLDNILELKEFKIKSQEEFESLKIQHQNELLQITQEKEKEKEILVKELSQKHQVVELELKNKITSAEKKLQEKETKIYELEIEIKINKENYDEMKSNLEQANKEIELKTEELSIKTKEVDSTIKELNLSKIIRDKLKQKLDTYENTNKTEVKITVNKNLLIEEKLVDSDDESEEDNISLSKPTNKEKDKYDEVDDLFSLEVNKKNLEFISTTNYTDSVNVALDTKDHVSCNGEDSFHSDTD